MSTVLDQKWDVFVSHNSQQKPWVRQAVDQFRHLGLNVFFDEDNIRPGDDIVEGIERGLNGSRQVVFVITPSACASRWVAMETASTIFADPDASKQKLIPVLLEPTAPEQIRLSVKRLRMVDLTNPIERRNNYHQLLRVLDVKAPHLPDPPRLSEGDTTAHGTVTKIQDAGHSASHVGVSAVEITINRELESFSDDDQAKLLRAIKDVLNVSGDIRIINRRRGSVVLKLALIPEQAEQLVLAVKKGRFANYDVVDAEIVETSVADDLEAVGLESSRREMPSIRGFEIKEVLGTGAFGTVYRAFDRVSSRAVAIKFARPDALPQAARFEREAKILAQMHHPNIVRVSDAGLEQGSCYIVMENREGRKLDEWVSENRLSWADATRLMAEVAESVSHVHRQSVIHRDLKPDNILLDTSRDGAPPPVVIADFGLARPQPSATQGEQVAGTTAYVAPEQFQDADVDMRADVFSLGVILFEMLTGKMREDDPKATGDAQRGLPSAIKQVCQKATESQPDKRFRDAEEFAKALRSALEQSN